MTRVRGLAGLAAVSIGCTVLLTGCGAVPDLNPGVAARVGDTTISTGEVHDVATDYCSAASSQVQGQPIPLSQINAQVASSLTLRAAAAQFAAEQGVTPASSYQETVDKAEAGGEFKGLSAAQKEAVITVGGTQYYVTAVEQAVGADGAAAFSKWLDEQDVRIDPRYGVTIDGAKPALADTGLSYAVSDDAKAGASSDPTAAAELPASQRCG